MIQYEKFYQDYERMEKFGLKAGVDPLKNRDDVGKDSGVPPEVSQIYQNISNYSIKLQIIDKICEELVKRDTKKNGMISDQAIYEVFRGIKMTINKKQLNFIIYPLSYDNQGNYNYLAMIEKLFGKSKA